MVEQADSKTRSQSARPAPTPIEDLPTEPELASGKRVASGDVALEPGALIASRYRIRRFLGKGAFGVAYEAEDTRLGVSVAVKLLNPDLKETPATLSRLRQEIVLSRKVSHPNVCRTYDLASAGRLHFLTMEFVPGECLDVVLKNRRPELRQAVDILRQICDGLEAAHAQGVIHRDLKPANIKIDERGKVTVMDFGLARDLATDDTESGMLVGSPAYWAPEQAGGHRATAQSDLYALGVIACELLGEPRPQLGKPPALEQTPKPLRAVVRRLLALNPSDRFASAAEARQALVVAVGLPAKTRRTARLGLLVGVAALALGVAFWAWFRSSVAPVEVALHVEAPVAPVSATRAPPSGSPLAVVTAPLPAKEVPRVVRPAAVKTVESRAASPSLPPAPPPLPKPVAPSPELAGMRQRLADLETLRTGRGILLQDVAGLEKLVADLQRNLNDGNVATSGAQLEVLSQMLSGVRIDKDFVQVKLKRLSARKAPPEKATQVAGVFAEVHSKYFAGDYAAANARLNSIWRLMGGAD